MESRAPLGSHLRRAAILVGMLVAIAVLRYITPPPESLPHQLSLNLYYIPILIAAYWYGVAGGLLIAVVSSIVYLNHVTSMVSTYDTARVAEVAIFHLVAITVGVLASAQRRVTDRYREIASMVERANTELRESYDQVRRADRLRSIGEVATRIADELRLPLVSIRGSLEHIDTDAARTAMAEVRRLDDRVSEFLQFAQPRGLTLRRSSVHAVATQAVTRLRDEAARAGVQLDLSAPVSEQHAQIDPVQVEEALSNVIRNAIQATRAGGRVAIREDATAIEVTIDVLDQGAGIPLEDHCRIFDPFFTTRDTGIGLGLAIAHRIVTMHGGGLMIAETSGRGTRVRIVLPVNGPAAPVRAAEERSSASPASPAFASQSARAANT